MTLTLKRRPRSVLGLILDDGLLGAALVVHGKDGLAAAKTSSGELSLPLLHQEPELVGFEIRNQLSRAGIRERACVLSVPADWIMSQHTVLPDLTEADVQGFLRIEAEKGFPFDAAQIQIAPSFQRSGGPAHVTQLAVRKDRLEQLCAVARAAGLRPVSLSLGLACVPGVIPPAGQGRITVAVVAGGTTFLIAAGGGIAAFRHFKAGVASEQGETLFNASAVARELRVTFEQVPADLRADVRQLVFRGAPAMTAQLAEALGSWPAAAGLVIEPNGGEAAALALQGAEGLGRRWLEGAGSGLEFLPAKPGRWAALLARTNAKRLGSAGLAAAALVAVGLPVLAWQQIRLELLRSAWGSMQAQVDSLTAVQDRIRLYRPWCDRSFPDLRILGSVTRCFPDSGSVTARSFEIHHVDALTTVSIRGTATDDRALLQTQDRLRRTGPIRGLKVESISGHTPSQFTFTFLWVGGSGS